MLDLDIREAFHIKYSNLYDNTARIVDELAINRGVVRIDLALLNGSINGFEIKGSKDTLNRLPKQIENYNNVFDYLSIILSETHLDKAEKMIPNWWGIQIAKIDSDDSIILEEMRESSPNPSQDLRILVELLWKNEALQLLEKHGLEKGMKSKNRNLIWDKVISEIEPVTVKKYTLHTLKTRADWR